VLFHEFVCRLDCYMYFLHWRTSVWMFLKVIKRVLCCMCMCSPDSYMAFSQSYTDVNRSVEHVKREFLLSHAHV
jgi:hypothetical protein